MTTKVKPEPVVVDLDARLAAIDEPEEERLEADARAREAAVKQAAKQARAAVAGEELVAHFKGAEEAFAAWKIAYPPRDNQQLDRDLPPRLAEAFEFVRKGSHALDRLAAEAGTVRGWVKELKGPLLVPRRLDEITAALKAARSIVTRWPSTRAEWTNLRMAARARLQAGRTAFEIVERAVATSAEDLAARDENQQRLDAAAAAMRAPTPPAPRRGIPGARLDELSAVQTSPRRPLLENLEDV